MTKLNELTKSEITKIATEKKITLSYKDENGKRQRFTKEQLIEKIEKLSLSNEYGNVAVNEKSHSLSIEESIKMLSLNEVIVFTINSLKGISTIEELNILKQKVMTSFNEMKIVKKRNLKSKWALQYNRLTMLFKQYESKLGAYNNVN